MNRIIDIPNVISASSSRKQTSVIIDEVSFFEELLIEHMPNFIYFLHMAKYSKKIRVRKKYGNKISNECTYYSALISNKQISKSQY